MGTCRDNAGNVSAPQAFSFQYDGSAPTVGATPSRSPDSNGWYSHALTVSFGGSDATSGVESCSSASYAGPDSASASIGGTCTDKAGNVGAGSFAVKYDSSPPVVSASPDRAPDGAGWYTHTVRIDFGATDALSGVASCTSASYDGPDSSSTAITGSCRDGAGNTAAAIFPLRYDATAPTLRNVAAVAGDHSARVNWKALDATTITVTRAVGGTGATLRYSGTAASFTDKGLVNGKSYRYTIKARDEAGNTTTATATAVPLALFGPAQGARLREPPLFQWAPVPHATYYNLQVMHNGKVLSAWPKVSRLQMPKEWRFEGRSHRLTPGLYRWYVWPGYGPRAKAEYGPRLGGSFFVVVKT